MNHPLLMHTVMRYQNLDWPELARRRETLAVFVREGREARRRRRREFVRRSLKRFSAFHRNGYKRVQRREGSAVGEARR